LARFPQHGELLVAAPWAHQAPDIHGTLEDVQIFAAEVLVGIVKQEHRQLGRSGGSPHLSYGFDGAPEQRLLLNVEEVAELVKYPG
jgi:hypothetical protein